MEVATICFMRPSSDQLQSDTKPPFIRVVMLGLVQIKNHPFITGVILNTSSLVFLTGVILYLISGAGSPTQRAGGKP